MCACVLLAEIVQQSRGYLNPFFFFFLFLLFYLRASVFLLLILCARCIAVSLRFLHHCKGIPTLGITEILPSVRQMDVDYN